MTDDVLFEQEPQLDAVRDKQSRRNLLVTGEALIVPTSKDTTATVLEIVNGPQGLIDVEIRSDQAWLRPTNTRMELLGGETRDLTIWIDPKGETENANLFLSWNNHAHSASVMITRKAASTPLPRDPPASAKPAVASAQASIRRTAQARSSLARPRNPSLDRDDERAMATLVAFVVGGFLLVVACSIFWSVFSDIVSRFLAASGAPAAPLETSASNDPSEASSNEAPVVERVSWRRVPSEQTIAVKIHAKSSHTESLKYFYRIPKYNPAFQECSQELTLPLPDDSVEIEVRVLDSRGQYSKGFVQSLPQAPSREVGVGD